MSKKFIEIVAEYLSICPYPGYKKKPYFSIRYEENGEIFEGFGTYNPKVLSEYIREYFMAAKKGKWIKRAPSLYRCSECVRFSPAQENFCPTCGADMRDAEDADLARDGSGATEEKTR